MHTLTLPQRWLADVLRRFLRGESRVELGLRIEFDAANGSFTALAAAPSPRSESSERLLVLPLSGPAASPPPDFPRHIVAVLFVAIESATAGQAVPWMRRRDGGWSRDVLLRLPGPGLPEIRPEGAARPELSDEETETWSRTAAGLGGIEPLRVVKRLSAGLAGCGRLGTGLVEYLASLPLRRLVLADPDKLESHNTGESGPGAAMGIGRRKVEVLAERLALWRPDIEVEAIPLSVTQIGAQSSLTTCDVLFSAADNAAARLATATLAAGWHIPLVDAGTRIHPLPQNGETMTADMRLIVPGDGCLMCYGGVGGERAARRVLRSADHEFTFASHRDWRSERRGSLRSWNLVALGAAARMWEEFLTGTLTRSTWWHLALTKDGRLVTETLTPPLSRPCLCELAGHGRAALLRLNDLLRERNIA